MCSRLVDTAQQFSQVVVSVYISTNRYESSSCVTYLRIFIYLFILKFYFVVRTFNKRSTLNEFLGVQHVIVGYRYSVVQQI